MIKNNEPLSMIEASKYIKKTEDEADVLGFIKKFAKVNLKEAKELRDYTIGMMKKDMDLGKDLFKSDSDTPKT